MDNQVNGMVNLPQEGFMTDFFYRNMFVIILIVIIILFSLGINIFVLVGNLLQNLYNIFAPFITGLLSFFGYTSASLIDKTVDLTGDGLKFGVDITQSVVHKGANFVKNNTAGGLNESAKQSLDDTLQTSPPFSHPVPQPSAAENPIQKPIASGKSGWCLTGEYQQKRGCVEVGEQDKCLSGQVFPTQKLCLNPNLTNNAK